MITHYHTNLKEERNPPLLWVNHLVCRQVLYVDMQMHVVYEK